MTDANTQAQPQTDEDPIIMLEDNFTNEQWVAFHKKSGGDLSDPGMTPTIEKFYSAIMPEVDRLMMEWCTEKPNEAEARAAVLYMCIQMMVRVLRLTVNHPIEALMIGSQISKGFSSGLGKLLASKIAEGAMMDAMNKKA